MTKVTHSFTGISPHSQVHPDANIGENVTIGPFCYVEEDVTIGDNTWIGPNVTIFNGSKIGNNCKIFPGAVIGGEPQDLKYKGENTTVEIGNYTTIREYVTINRGTQYAWTTKIGDHCLLMAYVHIAHDCMLGDHVILANAVNLAGHVIIEDWVIVEGLAAIQQFVHLGAHSFIAGGSLVRKNVPPFVKAAREPLSYAGVNKVGLSRRGFTAASIEHIQNIYRYIYVHGQNISQSVEKVTAVIPDSPERSTILTFIDNSANGIMKGFYSLTENGRQNGNGKHHAQ